MYRDYAYMLLSVNGYGCPCDLDFKEHFYTVAVTDEIDKNEDNHGWEMEFV